MNEKGNEIKDIGSSVIGHIGGNPFCIDHEQFVDFMKLASHLVPELHQGVTVLPPIEPPEITE